MKAFVTMSADGARSRIYVQNTPKTAPVCPGCINCRPTPRAPTMTLAQAEAKLAALESEALRRRIASWCKPILEGPIGSGALD